MHAFSNQRAITIGTLATATSLLTGAAFAQQRPTITDIRFSGPTNTLMTVQNPPGVTAYNIFAADSLGTPDGLNHFFLAQRNFPATPGKETVWRDSGALTHGHPAASGGDKRFYGVEALTNNLPYYVCDQWPTIPEGWIFSDISGITSDHAGNLYVADNTEKRIKVFESSGRFLGDIAVPDIYYASHLAVDGKGQIFLTTRNGIKKYVGGREVPFSQGNSQPGCCYAEITTDSQSNVYVSDVSNFQIYKFNDQGNYLLSIGKGYDYSHPELADGEFYNSMWTLGVVVDSAGNIFVADNHYYRVQKFAPDGTFVKSWSYTVTPVSDWQLGQIFTIDNDNVIYLAHEHSSNIQRFDTNLQELDSLPGPTNIFWGHNYFMGGAPAPDRTLYVAAHRPPWDSIGYEMVELNPSGEIVSTWTSASIENGRFRNPISLARDAQGTILVADNPRSPDFNGRIQEFTADGHSIASYTFPKWIDRIHTDAQRNLYVVYDDNTLGKFDLNRSPVWNCNFKTNLPPSYLLRGMEVDTNQNFYLLVSAGNAETPLTNFVYKFKSDGRFDSAWPRPDYLSRPGAMTLSADGLLYVADQLNNKIFLFDLGGNMQASWKGIPLGGVSAIAVDDKKRLFMMADTGTDLSLCELASSGQMTGLQYITSSVGTYTEADRFVQMVSFTLAPDGKIYVVDKSKAQVQILAPIQK